MAPARPVRRLLAGLGSAALAAALIACDAGPRPTPTAFPATTTAAPTTTASPTPTPTPTPTRTVSGVPVPEHVVVVVLENKDTEQVLGNSAAPYVNSLAAAGANLAGMHAETHPSQPNYLALFSGSTQGIDGDGCFDQKRGPSLGGQLLAAGRTFTGYSEGLPSVGFTGCGSGKYARKHAPWVDFADVPASANRPLSDLPGDWSQLPTVSFVIPDLCNDMHSCSVATGDRWMRAHLADYVDWARDHNSLLLVTFDESESDNGNQIATLWVGGGVRPGSYAEHVDHYRLLRTIEEMYGLAPLGRAAATSPITDIWG